MSEVPTDAPVRLSSGRHVSALDGLRGIAILLVMASHYAGSLDVLGVPHAEALPFRLGWAGVDVFFALSGFLITGILLDTRSGPRFFINFYARRFLRIAPLYYAAILVVGLLQFDMGPDRVWGDTAGLLAPGSLFWPLTYLENMAFCLDGPSSTGILAHYWSLAVEEHFYLVWPLLVWACSRRSLAIIAGLAIAGAVLLRAAAVVGGADPAWIMGLTPLRVDGLALGALASVLLRSEWPVVARTRVAWAVLALAAACLAGVIGGRHTLSQFDPVLWVFGYTLVAAASAALILLGSVPGRVASLLSNRVLRWCGRYSFGLYVWHPIIATLLLHSRSALVSAGQPAAAVLLVTGATVALTLGWAWLSFHYFEQPFLALKRFFAADREALRPHAVVGFAGPTDDLQPAAPGR